MQVKVWSVFENCRLESQKSSQHVVEEVNELESNHHWTEDNLKLGSVKLNKS